MIFITFDESTTLMRNTFNYVSSIINLPHMHSPSLLPQSSLFTRIVLVLPITLLRRSEVTLLRLSMLHPTKNLVSFPWNTKIGIYQRLDSTDNVSRNKHENCKHWPTNEWMNEANLNFCVVRLCKTFKIRSGDVFEVVPFLSHWHIFNLKSYSRRMCAPNL